MCTGAPDCETMNRLNKIEDGPEGDTPSFVSPTSGSTTEVKPVLSLSTSPDSRQSDVGNNSTIDVNMHSSQESVSNPSAYEDANSLDAQDIGNESIALASDLPDACPIVVEKLARLNKSHSFPRCSGDKGANVENLSLSPQGSSQDSQNADNLTPKSNDSKRLPSQGSIPKAASAVRMDVEQATVSLILKDDDYDLDDVSLVSSINSPSEVTNCSEVSGISTTEGDSVSVDWSFSTDSTPTASIGYTYVATHDEVRPLNSGQPSINSSGSKQSYSSSSPPVLTRVQSNSRISSDKKKKPYWYNQASLVLSPTYKSRSEDFKRIFKDIPSDERLIVDYSCALQKDILIHGRLYITQNSICFYANIFRWETILTLRCKDITSMTKEKTARVIPNAIQICTKDDKYFFTSFGTRDKTYLMLFRVWQNALVDHPMTPQELWQWVHYSYGEELGLNSSDEDYVQPSTEDEHVFSSRVQQEERIAAVLEGVGVGNKDDTDSFSEPLTNGDILQSCTPEINNASVNETDRIEIRHAVPVSQSVGVNNLDTTSLDMPTDVGDTSEDDEEVPCSGHDHLDIPVVEAEYNFSVDKLFEMIFTDSDLYRHFTEVKKTTELVQSQWSEDVDSEGDRHRVISYTLSLNYSIGPKTSPATEKQALRSVSKPGAFYLVDTECINSSIPYGDNFYVVNRYCLNRLGLNRCRLKVTSAVRYRKSVWGVVKVGFIEKNVTNGIIDSFTCLADLLQEESAILGQDINLGPCVGKKKVLRRRRNTTDRPQSTKHPSEIRTQPEHGSSSPVKTHLQKVKVLSNNHRDDKQQAVTTDVLVRVICTVLIVLAVFNGLLFYKLWSLEQKILPFHFVRPDLWKNTNNEVPQSQQEWKQLLEQQRQLHHTEIDHWKEVLSTSAKLMHNMQLTLESLEQGINAKYQRTDVEDKSSHRHDEH